jgi:predicted anti-sigma-YlaC factor YlaD
MHGSVRVELENLLAAEPSAAATNIASHVLNCGECASELDSMRQQSRLLKTLQAPEEIEPSAGFYARVMQRIEEGARRSIWWVFVYSPIGKRLAYASLALTVVLGTYVVAAESNDGDLTLQALIQKTPSKLAADHFDPPVMGNVDEQRAAVLENFVAHPVSDVTMTVQ